MTAVPQVRGVSEAAYGKASDILERAEATDGTAPWAARRQRLDQLRESLKGE